MTIKPYILGSVVARGGMAEIYRGLHVGQDGFQRLVAIKRILPHHAQNAEFAEMFRDEAHIGQRLQHANIVKVEGFDMIEGSPSIIMEFIDGSDLRAVLAATENRKMSPGKRPHLPAELCVYIVAEAARGLHYAHTRRDDVTGKPLNIVHRDISPQNILISWEGEVKITDFGIAAADRDFKQTETKAGIVKGKYSYMSPEQISGKKCDARTDIFALSIVLWEMLTMHRMFTSDNEFEVIEMVRNCKIPIRMRDINPSITEELETIVLRGLAKDPRRRYESMEIFERTLRGFLAKLNATLSANEVSLFVKDVLSDRRDAAREEMRKILTSAKLKASESGPGAPPSRTSLELALDSGNQSTSTLTIGRATRPPTSVLASQNPQSLPGFRGTSAHRAVQNKQYEQQRMQQKSGRKPGSSFPFIPAAMVLLLACAVAFKNYQNAARQALTLTVKSSPEIVRIKINERDHANGKYVATPARIRLDPGLNSVEFSRDGYDSEKILVNTDSGIPKSHPTVKLKPNATFAPVRLEYRGTDPVTITVNSGFYRQKFTQQQNIFQVPDLPSGENANIAVISSEKKIISRCSFTPTNTSERRPLLIVIDGTKKGCEIVGQQKKDDRQ